jgi:signal transduction histidine kinase
MTYQIFQEIIDNAIKFTLSGKVCVKLFTDVSKKITVNISDTGVGISEEYLQNIFKPFSQEDTGYSRKFEGNGLALALVKKYADINEIIIDVTSKKKVGSSFTLQFK